MRNIITIGNFDGIHLGHRKLLGTMLLEAERESLNPVVITYGNHPAYTLYHPAAPMLLMPIPVRIRKLKELGIDEVEVLDFTQGFADTAAYDFLSSYLIPTYHPAVIVVGFDSHFGKGREGNYHFLERYASEYDYRLIYIDPVMHDDAPVSSSMIRNMLRYGNVTDAAKLLTHPYCIGGKVEHGKGWGKGMGFPTANLHPNDPLQLIPAMGIYLTRVHLQDRAYYGLTNIGTSPTLKKDNAVQIETYIIDFNGDVYDADLRVEFLQYLREEKVFGTKEELIQAMQGDLLRARKLIGEME